MGKERPGHIVPALRPGEPGREVLTAMSRAVLGVLECPDVETAAAQILEACRSLIGASEGRLAILDHGGAGRWIARIGPTGRPVTRSLRSQRPSAGPGRLVAAAGAGLRLNRADRRRGAALPLPRGCAAWRSLLVVPLEGPAGADGVLLLGEKAGGFTGRDLLVASTFGALAAAAHRRCMAAADLERRVAAVRRDLGRVDRELRHRVRALEEARASLRREQAFRSAVEKSLLTGIIVSDLEGRLIHVNRALARMLGFPVRDLLGATPPYPFWPRGRRQEYLEAFAGLAKGPLPRQGFRLRFRRRGGEPIDVWLMVSPLSGAGGAATGWVASVGDITEQLRTEEALRQAADQLREVSARLLEAEERERKRIARELHDSLGQTLTALRYRIEEALAECRRCGGGPPVVRGRLEEAIRILGDAGEEVRRIVADLRPAILDDLGLASAIRWFCREFQRTSPAISCRVQVAVRDGAVPAHLKTAIFRLVQEGLTNVSRHSRARMVTVSLALRGGRVRLSIEDDGRGLRARTARGGSGIAGMRERTRLSGGTFELRARSEGGTILEADWPAGDAATRRARA